MSYQRSDKILTKHLFEYCTYVVREKDADAYRRAGIDNMLVLPEGEVWDFMSTLYWLIQHTPEDVIFVADDDIEKFVYRLDTTTYLEMKDGSHDKEKITSEVERIAQLIYDLNIRLAFDQPTFAPYAYTAEFSFVGMPGHMRWINRKALKAVYDKYEWAASDVNIMTTTTSEISPLLGSKGDSTIYTFNRNRLIDNYEAITTAFTAKYANFKIAYSFKTNYLKEIVTTVQSLGGLAEVVSPYELQYAQALKFAPAAIVYNGVIPDLERKYYIAANHGIVNIDNYTEFTALRERAEERHEPIRLGLRVNLDVGNGAVSRFGVDPDGEEFQKIMQEIRDSRYVELGGFHCHIGSARPVRYWKEKTLKLIDLLQKYGGCYLDFGGGMFGLMPESLAKQFSDYPASFQPYAEVTAGLLKEAFPDERGKMIV